MTDPRNVDDTWAGFARRTVTAMSRRRRSTDYTERSWWTQDHGGLPGWAIVAACAVIVSLGAVVAVLLMNPR